jgi:hypothetical protein
MSGARSASKYIGIVLGLRAPALADTVSVTGSAKAFRKTAP